MSDDEAAFLAQIIAEPDDDTHRLVYADWLQEHGQDERAGYIRLAVAHHSHTTTLCSGEGLAIDPKWKYWLQEWTRTYVTLFKAPRKPKGFKYTLRRGFVDQITCTAADWLAHGDAIRAAHPVTQVRLTTTPQWEAVRSTPEFDAQLLDHNGNRVGVVARIKWQGHGVEETRRQLIALLEANWPGVAFELPA